MHPTAQRLLDATEELLVERGQAQVSLRDITERAGANVAAVSYHFRSKDALVAEVFAHALDEVTSLRREHLHSVSADAPLAEVVQAWLAPALDPASVGPREARLWALIARGMREQAPGLAPLVASRRSSADDELLELLGARLPHLDPDELRVRHAATVAALASLGPAAGEASAAGSPLPAETAPLVLDWIVAGLSGPGRQRDR